MVVGSNICTTGFGNTAFFFHRVSNNMCVFVQYERQLAEHQEKTNRLQRRLTQAEQRAATAAQQVAITCVCGLC